MSARLEQCSDVLLSIYSAAARPEGERFQAEALHALHRLIGFESAWWGILSPTESGFVLESSCRLELSDAFEQQWRGMAHDDTLARDATGAPRRTVRFDTRDLRSTRGLFELNSEHDIRHALCTSIPLRDQGDAFVFVSLFRRGRSRRFCDADVRLKQFLMPHLEASWRLSMVGSLSREAAGVAAYIDRRGRIIEADPRFASVLCELWPDWSGPGLPAPLVEIVSEPSTQGSQRVGPWSISVRSSGSLSVLRLSRVSAVEGLTPREAEVAVAFASGLSYKQIARDRDLAPATVRHHLRAVYGKLQVRDKAALANLIHGAESLRAGLRS